jgi:hypothetical protein
MYQPRKDLFFVKAHRCVNDAYSGRVDFNRRLMLRFCGYVVASDAAIVGYRELDDALGFTEMAGETLADARTAGTAAMRWSVCCGSRCSAALLDMMT